MTANNRGETAKKPRGRPFLPGNRANPRGRPKGRLNKVTVEARAAASEIVDDARYRQKLAARALRGDLPPAIEQMLWFYAKGRPKEDGYSVGAVTALVRELVSLSLSLARSDGDRQRIALAVRRLTGEPMPAALPPASMEDEVTYVDLTL